MKFFSKKMVEKSNYLLSGLIYSPFSSLQSKKINEHSPLWPDSKGASKPAVVQVGVKKLKLRVGQPLFHNPSSNFIQIDLASSDEIKNWAQRSYFIEDKQVSDASPSARSVVSREVGPSGPREAAATSKWPPKGPTSKKLQSGQTGRIGAKSTSSRGGGVAPGAIFEIGEVKRADTLNYRTFKPEKDGLFCEKIFGPINDWTCSCGHLKEQKFTLDHEKILLGKLKPKLCPLCLVEASTSRLRRYRMGYISLACPVTHIWYLNSRPSLFSILLKMPTKYIKKVAYYKAYSPSSSQREYMSSCLGPGGDFFDNEWEFLHIWLSGKHSLEDFPSPLTKKASTCQAGGTEKTGGQSDQVTAKTRNKKAVDPFGSTSLRLAPSGLNKPAIQQVGSRLRFRQREIKIHEVSSYLNKFNTRSVKLSLLGPTTWPSSFGATGSGATGSGATGRGQLKNFKPQLHAQTTGRGAERPGPHIIRHLATQIKINQKDSASRIAPLPPWPIVTAPSGTLQVGLQNETKPLASSTVQGKAILQAAHLIKKFPESPNWLLNTGAQSLLNQLESRNWEKEIEKLELESSFQANIFGLAGESQAEDPYTLSSVRQAAEREDSENELKLGAKSFTQPAPAGAASRHRQSRGVARFAEVGDLIDSFFEKRRKNRIRILKLLKSFQKSGLRFSSMIFETLPVLPPELRPIIQLGGGQLASSDVNDLYRRIISRNNRLKYYLYETHFVEFLVRSEQQLVQLAVDALLENGKTTSVRHTSGQKRLYKSLSDRIGGKQGRFRMNLLGKRVDYSGRSVIVVGPRLKLFQCGLPYEMGIELFQPFLLRHMLELQLAKTIRGAKTILRFNKPLARQLLHHVVKAHPILLNRAPTLHRLGIQAFQPVLVFGRAIHLHPLVCPAFNADFDGDQMAVHIPLSPQARVEARLLLLASGNWLSSSTGQPNLLPSQDMVLGFYYLTIEKYGYQKGRGNTYLSLADIMQAYELGLLDLHSQVWVKWSGDFTSDINTRLSSPQSHDLFLNNFLNTPQGTKGTIFLKHPEGLEGLEGPEKGTFSKEIQSHRNNLYMRFRRETDQPIELRLNRNKLTHKIYSSYQWRTGELPDHTYTSSSGDDKNRALFIRTTPGRVLMNQIFQKYL